MPPGGYSVGLSDFVLLVVATIAALAAGLAMFASQYPVARVCFWTAGLSFGVMGVLWSLTTKEDHPLWLRLIVSGAVGAIAAVGLTWALWEISQKEKIETPSIAEKKDEAEPEARKPDTPTLEASRGAVIDAQGAIIPGDLPFQFAKASDGALISMSGVSVTKKEDGSYLVTPGGAGPVTKQFPPPKGEFSSLSNPQLIEREKEIGAGLRQLQQHLQQTLAALPRTQDREARRSAVTAAYNALTDDYAKHFKGSDFDLGCEFLARLGKVDDVSNSAKSGGEMLLYKAFAGPTPASDIADFLDFLAGKLKEKLKEKS